MTMIEKVARAIYDRTRITSDAPWDACPEYQREFSISLARAALLSLKEVDDGTVEAMRLCTIRNSRPVDPAKPFESPFVAALDHILTGGAE